ncbi:MAG: pyridoxal-phosphate dependent enzyme [Chitinophagaceae bacterium]|nr:pyridoxal-phosphate dependent enzyme [Chitinophagaceae bacterium]
MNSEEIIQVHAVTTDAISDLLLTQKQIRLSVLRLDKIHPVISGNKWFKLIYYLTDARSKDRNTILTFGGAYSNHIAATAFAAKLYGFQSIGLIRGEMPETWSHTLQEAQSNGMSLHFLSRANYNLYKRNGPVSELKERFGNAYIIPEGGMGHLGVKGAAEIVRSEDISNYSHIISAVGTGTTIAGLLNKTTVSQQIVGISSMKNNNSLFSEIELLFNRSLPGRFHLVNDYHFGGYAKYTDALIQWMNHFYKMHHIPLDFVYTGKMMYGIFDLAGKDFFPPGSHILAVHTGGLQGNHSLPPGMLGY